MARHFGAEESSGLPARGGPGPHPSHAREPQRPRSSLDHAMESSIAQAIRKIPHGQFLLTAAYDGRRTGVLVEWVQQCATNPPMVMIAIVTGSPIAPLIRDSRVFALCQISADDKSLARKFATSPAQGDDPFFSIRTTTAPSGSPIVQRAAAFLDCELIRHVDLESDCGLYVGMVRHGGVLNGHSE